MSFSIEKLFNFDAVKNTDFYSFLPWFQSCELVDPYSLDIKGILLASEGRPFTPAVVDYVARLSKSKGAPVYILCILRIFGTGWGFPCPGLLPSKREWDKQQGLVDVVIKALQRRKIKAEARVVATRKSRKRIVSEAERLGCSVIVMSADPPRHWLVSDFLWTQEPYRVRRRAKMPVYLVVDP